MSGQNWPALSISLYPLPQGQREEKPRRGPARHFALPKPQSNQFLRHNVSPLGAIPFPCAGGLPDQLRACRRRAETCGREIMHIVANRLVATSLAVFTALTAMQAKAADVDATSAGESATRSP